MLAYSMKSYLCHTCQKISLIDSSNLICPHCGNDFLEETTTARAQERPPVPHEPLQDYQYINYYCHTCRKTSLISPHNLICPRCQGTILEEASNVRPTREPEFQSPEEPQFDNPFEDPHEEHRWHHRSNRDPQQANSRHQRPRRRRQDSPLPDFPGFPSWNNDYFRDFERDPFAEFDSFFNGDFFGRRQERVLGRLFGDLNINPSEYFNQQFGGFDDIINLISQRYGQETHPASEESINHLKKRKVQKGEEIQKCSVCMDDIAEGSEANVLSCNHVFHPDCIQPWLRVKNTCPVCRKEVR